MAQSEQVVEPWKREETKRTIAFYTYYFPFQKAQRDTLGEVDSLS
jgi:hypothetical protein